MSVFIVLIIPLIVLVPGVFIPWIISRQLVDVRKKYSSSFQPDTYAQYAISSLQKIYFQATDKTPLCASYFPAYPSVRQGLVIFLHGIRFGKEYYYKQAAYLSKLGYHCLLPDLRGHGESGGCCCTYGFLEKSDIAALITYARENLGIHSEIAIWGHSMGAAVALQCMAKDKRIKLGIMEAPFSNLTRITREYVHRKMPLFPLFLVPIALLMAGKKAGFDPKSIHPAADAKTIKYPVMVIHGTKDERITISHSIKIYDALPGDNKIFFEVKNADHHNIATTWGNEYMDRTTGFIKKNFSLYEYS